MSLLRGYRLYRFGHVPYESFAAAMTALETAERHLATYASVYEAMELEHQVREQAEAERDRLAGEVEAANERIAAELGWDGATTRADRLAAALEQAHEQLCGCRLRGDRDGCNFTWAEALAQAPQEQTP